MVRGNNGTGGHPCHEVRVEGYEERKWGQEPSIELKISVVFFFCFFLGETVVVENGCFKM